ncbi:hypothetical protein KUTeg_019200 [Tegillarca granosa]|uniref:Uncharacterized protein n=1 Tax=Tegillarca granosa TaxID=220873 RepID=A0ABQ9EDX7_TEGGR|nr:hypothetical protein KUTeg_019200 [Tegillarca granosa]
MYLIMLDKGYHIPSPAYFSNENIPNFFANENGQLYENNAENCGCNSTLETGYNHGANWTKRVPSHFSVKSEHPNHKSHIQASIDFMPIQHEPEIQRELSHEEIGQLLISLSKGHPTHLESY